MAIKHLWDTNVVIYFLQRQLPATAELWLDEQLTDSLPCISAITEIELLSWNTSEQKDLAIVRNFIQETRMIELEQPIKWLTASIRKEYRTKLPDAIIAATAINYNIPLVTRNVADFKQIKGLTLIDIWNK